MSFLKLTTKTTTFYIKIEEVKKAYVCFHLEDDLSDDYLTLCVSRAANQIFKNEDYVRYWAAENIREVIKRCSNKIMIQRGTDFFPAKAGIGLHRLLRMIERDEPGFSLEIVKKEV